MLERIVDSHGPVAGGVTDRRSPSGAAAKDCFAGELSCSPSGAPAFEFDRTGLADVRRRVERVAAGAGMSAGDVADLVVSASELAANSIVHGGGSGTLRIWREARRLVVEVEDGGLIEEPLVGRLRPEPTQRGGRGLWIVNQICDLVQIRSGAGGTTVRLQMAIN